MSHEPRGPTDGCISAWEGDRPNVGEPERMSGDCNLTIDKCYRRDYLRTTVGAPARIFGDDFSLGD
jgi:hypothetical protein